MAYRVSITRVTLDYFSVDVDDDSQNVAEAIQTAKAQIEYNPAYHQLGNQDVGYITTEAKQI